MDRAMKQSTRQFYKIFFHISKCLAYNSEETLQLKIIYIPILYVTTMTQNKNIQKTQYCSMVVLFIKIVV